MDVKEMNYKGFAYIQGNNKPYVLFGNSQEEIILRLQGYNRARTPDAVYKTCNIGVLSQNENGTDQYENYKRFEVATGKDITPVYLKLPSLNKDDFRHLTQQLKDDGARFNSIKKQWYVTPDLAEKFKDYIPDPEEGKKITILQEQQKNESVHPNEQYNFKSEMEEVINEPIALDLWENRLGFSNIEANLNITLENGKKYVFKMSELGEGFEQKPFVEKMQILEDAIDRDMQETHGKSSDYILDISSEVEDNTCTVFFNDGRDPIQLHGDQFGVSFPQISRESAQELIDTYLLNQAENYNIEEFVDYVIGKRIDAMYVQGEQDHSVRGIVFDVNDKEVMLRFDYTNNDINPVNAEEYAHFYRKDIYTDAQMKWIYELDEMKIDRSIICNAEYNPAQMEQIVEGYKDGLRSEQIKTYANLDMPSWKMDLFRVGLQHGISADQIKEISSTANDWISGRDKLNIAVREHRAAIGRQIETAGFRADKTLIRKIEHMNHLTGKENTVKDICQAFKSGMYKDNENLNQLVRDIGKTFQMQEMAVNQIPVQ